MPQNNFYLTDSEIFLRKNAGFEKLVERWNACEEEYYAANELNSPNWKNSYPTENYMNCYEDVVQLISSYVTDYIHDDHDEIIFGFDYINFEKTTKTLLEQVTKLKK